MDPMIRLFFEDGFPDLNAVEHVVQDLVRPLPLLKVTQRKQRIRNKKYFEVTIPSYSDIQFYEHFSMSRESAEVFTLILANTLPNADQMAPLRKKLLFCVWVLSKQESFVATSDRFDLPVSTGYTIFKQIVLAISSLLPQFVKWPNVSSYEGEAAIFHSNSGGFPGVVGAIDGCRISCKQPVGYEVDCNNKKESHSIVLQGTCDHQGKFIDVYIGSPGSMHDAIVFRNSPLYEKLAEPDFIPQDYHLLGDSAYPLRVNLMTPFRNNGHLTPAQLNYNTKLSSARSTVERAFGHLKGRFRRLKHLDISNFELGNNMIAAACVLHNFIIDQNISNSNMEHDPTMDQSLEPLKNMVFNEDIEDTIAAQKRNNIVALFL